MNGFKLIFLVFFIVERTRITKAAIHSSLHINHSANLCYEQTNQDSDTSFSDLRMAFIFLFKTYLIMDGVAISRLYSFIDISLNPLPLASVNGIKSEKALAA